MTSLIERIEAATGGSRELDGAVATSLDWWPKEFTRVDSFASWRRWTDVDSSWSECVDAPQFSTSIDAARSIPPGALCVFASDIGADGMPMVKVVTDTSTTPIVEYTGIAATLELAWCAAILRARQMEARE